MAPQSSSAGFKTPFPTAEAARGTRRAALYCTTGEYPHTRSRIPCVLPTKVLCDYEREILKIPLLPVPLYLTHRVNLRNGVSHGGTSNAVTPLRRRKEPNVISKYWKRLQQEWRTETKGPDGKSLPLHLLAKHRPQIYLYVRNQS